jgi:hypothetical protein
MAATIVLYTTTMISLNCHSYFAFKTQQQQEMVCCCDAAGLAAD